MKIFIRILSGALVGFVIAYLLMSILDEIQFMEYSNLIVGTLYLLTFFMLAIAIILSTQIHRLNSKQYEGEEEDEVEVIKYKKFSDHSLLVQSSSVLAVLATSVTIATTMSMLFIAIGAAFIIISYILQATLLNLLRKVYPERNLPSINDPNYEQKLLAVSDEGERHVMLQGLYKVYNLLNVLLVFAIVGATIYSIISNDSQIFSIFLMSIVLILINGRYMLSIRNR